MKGSRVAIRYAKALLATAQEHQAVDQVADDMESVYTTLENSQELKAVLASPVISADLKGDTLKAIFGKVSPVVKTFLALVAENNRANHLDGVTLKYKQLYQELQGKQEAEVTTAVPLTPALEKVVMEKIKTLTDKKVELVSTVDQDIIGGFILRLGDQQFDASVANQLQSLEHKLSNRKALA
ncbi:MAG: ATP synthase F1 subunit delta [Bacteroidota bacterium]|nr:ATP synthase F1 subunit delta [Bacteroidota bacterium]